MKLRPDVSLTPKSGLIIALITASKRHSGLSTLSQYFSLQKLLKIFQVTVRVCKKNTYKMELKMKDLPFSQYEEKMKKDDHEGLKVQSCIFLVCKSHGFWGVSADGLVTD